MRRSLKLIAAAVVAFAVTLVAFLPASLVTRYVPPNVTLGMTSGTVWRGASDALAVDGRYIGALKWRVRFSSLLRGRLGLQVELLRPDGGGTGQVLLSRAQRLEVRDAQLRWPLESLPVRFMRSTWSGQLELALSHAIIEPTGVKRLLGTVDALNLRNGTQGPAAGSYRATFDEASQQGERIVGRLQSLDGPLGVTGTITLGPARSYLVTGLVAARPGAPPELERQLRILGPPDPQGRRPFTIEGAF